MTTGVDILQIDRDPQHPSAVSSIDLAIIRIRMEAKVTVWVVKLLLRLLLLRLGHLRHSDDLEECARKTERM